MTAQSLLLATEQSWQDPTGIMGGKVNPNNPTIPLNFNEPSTKQQRQFQRTFLRHKYHGQMYAAGFNLAQRL